ncbi:YmdB family metallophosphoesterase [candidate division WWE3 bacterium]|uniref:YmdB family metallophosphoesterase n=1 Tax=candidate division WWE3 bacterium TaxID=2053526 RepID=A0A7X9E6U6_UNCKA|nr:YmdB family metallophosphoesterase [candidate division WWE3 bacterium]
MKILFVGEIVAKPGREIVSKFLPGIIKTNKVDLVFANAENLSGGRGVTEEKLDQMKLVGVDYFTSGEHIFWEKGTEDIIDKLPILRPANYPLGTPGEGYKIIDAGENGQVLLINLMGVTSYSGKNAFLDNPFAKVDEILEETKDQEFVAKIVDFHAEATSEKYSLGFYLDGRVDAVVGTHTHVPTCDNYVLPKGTLYVTDVGMCGAVDSSLGVKADITIKMFKTAMNQRFEWESAGRKAFRSVLLDLEAKSIVRIDNMI